MCWTLQNGENPGFSLYDFADRLRGRGWQVPAYSMPPNRSDLVVQRILVRHGFTGCGKTPGTVILRSRRRS